MNSLKNIISVLLALLLLVSGVGHFVAPEMYFPMIPEFLPEAVVNSAVGLLEILLGIGVFITAYRTPALTGIFLLMIVFLPIHIWDALKAEPAIGSKAAAYMRIGFQFVLIYLPWFARR